MTDDLHFRPDLYVGTAADYDAFRVPYPRTLTDDLLRRAGTSGVGRMLDLGCGTGQITFALCDHFAEVWAVDLEPGTIEFAREKAARLGVDNVRWYAQAAESVEGDAFFSLVTAGNAFHRLPRERVAQLAMQWLVPGGHIALVWSSTPWIGAASWQDTVQEVSMEWADRLDARDRVPSNFEEHMASRPNVDVLRDAGFEIVGNFEFVKEHEWSVETLIGFAYSTSILPRAVVGECAEDFERDMRERLLAVEPSGVFRDEISAAYDLARRP